MNTFANSLFTLLFGWARGLIQRVWAAAVSGRFSGFFVWLGDHWVWVVLGLILGCTLMDYLIWLIRWRPYLLWRGFFRRASRFFQMKRRQFEKGYQSSVDIRLSPEQEAPRTEAEAEPPEEAWFSEAWSQAPAEEPPAAASVFSPSAEREPRARQFTPPQAYEAPPLYAAPRPVSSSFPVEMQRARRRRSEKYARRRQEWRDRLLNGDAAEYDMLDGLPPAVDRQQAFHEPVYPRQDKDGETAYAAWQRPENGGRTNG